MVSRITWGTCLADNFARISLLTFWTSSSEKLKWNVSHTHTPPPPHPLTPSHLHLSTHSPVAGGHLEEEDHSLVSSVPLPHTQAVCYPHIHVLHYITSPTSHSHTQHTPHTLTHSTHLTLTHSTHLTPSHTAHTLLTNVVDLCTAKSHPSRI